MPSTQDKPVILVTGGAKRVGAELCRAFSHAGWRVVIHCCKSRDEAESLAAELVDAKVVQADLLVVSADAFITQALNAFGRIDLLVNNASTYRRGGLLSSSDTDYLEDFAINFHVPFALMRAYSRLVDQGSIINVLDARIVKDDIDCAGYLLAKKTLAEATRVCALDLAEHGMRVNGIAPGFVRPKDGVQMSVMEHLVAKTPLGVRTTEAQIADAALYLSRAVGVTGEILFVDAGMHLSPVFWDERK